MAQSRKPSSIAKTVKSPSDLIRDRITIEAKKEYKESKELTQLIQDIIAVTLAITKKLVGPGTRLFKLSSQTDAARMHPEKALSVSEKQECAELRKQFEVAKFHAYKQIIKAAYDATTDLKLEALLGVVLFEADRVNAQFSLADQTKPDSRQPPMDWLLRRTENMADIYRQVHTSGDYKEETENLPQTLQALIQKTLVEYATLLEESEELDDGYDSDSDDEKDEASFKDVLDYLAQTDYVKTFPKESLVMSRISNTYPIHMIDDLLLKWNDKPEVNKALIAAIPFNLCVAYHVGISLTQTIPMPDVKDDKFVQKMQIHNAILQRVSDYKKAHQAQFEMKEQKKEAIKKDKQSHVLDMIQKTILIRFVEVLEQKYQNKLNVVCASSTIGKIFQKPSKKPTDYIKFINRTQRHHHLHRMIVLTLNDIYTNYSDLLHPSHKKLFTAGIVCPAEYSFESPFKSTIKVPSSKSLTPKGP